MIFSSVAFNGLVVVLSSTLVVPLHSFHIYFRVVFLPWTEQRDRSKKEKNETNVWYNIQYQDFIQSIQA